MIDDIEEAMGEHSIPDLRRKDSTAVCAVHLRQINDRKIGIVHWSDVSNITKIDEYHARLAFVGGAAV